MASFCLWYPRTPAKLWDVMTPKLKIVIIDNIVAIMFCAHNSVNFGLNDMCYVSSDDVISLWHLNSKLSWPKNWKFHHYNIVGICCFVLRTRLILDLTTCAIPLCKALTDAFISSMTPNNSDQVMGTLWPKNWKFHPYNIVAMSRFVLITRSIFNLTTCAIPLCKALTHGFIMSMTPKTSDQVMGTLWPKNWKFHHYNIVAMSRFVLITRSIFNLTTCAISLCKALTDGFISSMTPKNSGQVMGTLWPQNWKFHHYNIVAISCFVLITRFNFWLNDMCHTSV